MTSWCKVTTACWLWVMNAPVWKLLGWLGSLGAAPSQTGLSSWTPPPSGTGSSGPRLEIASFQTSMCVKEAQWRQNTSATKCVLLVQVLRHNYAVLGVCLFVVVTCEAWASLSIVSWMDLDEILCLELHRAECTWPQVHLYTPAMSKLSIMSTFKGSMESFGHKNSLSLESWWFVFLFTLVLVQIQRKIDHF